MNNTLCRSLGLLATIVILGAPQTAMGTNANLYSVAKEDGGFSFTTDKVYVNHHATGTSGLMASFKLHVQWRTLLGEAIEYYDIRWTSTGKYKIDGRWVYRKKLEKYPDLLKRFDNLRPSKFSVKLEGTASGGTLPEGVIEDPLIEHTYKGFDIDRSEAEPQLHRRFVYVIDDRKLLYTKSGQVGSGIVGGSPHWNEFIYWGSPQVVFWNNSIYPDDTGSKQDKALEKRNKTFYANTKEITFTVEKEQLEWPEHELRAIAQKYDKYESGEEEPSPKQEVADAQDEVKRTKPHNKGDFWGRPPEPAKQELETFYRDGKEGVRNKHTKAVVVEPRYNYILKKDLFGSVYWEADNCPCGTGGNGHCATVEEYKCSIVFDSTGKQAPIKPFTSISSDPENRQSYAITSVITALRPANNPDSVWCGGDEKFSRYDEDWNLISTWTESTTGGRICLEHLSK